MGGGRSTRDPPMQPMQPQRLYLPAQAKLLTTNNQQTNAKQLPSSPNMSLLLVTPMEQSQSTATCNEMKTEIMLIICKINNNKE